MGNTALKTEKGCTLRLILGALYALISILMFWLTASSEIFQSISLQIGNAHASIEPALIAITAVYVLSIFLTGIFRKCKPLCIVLSAVSCLIALSYFIPANGLKTAAIADAFIKREGRSVSLAFECLRRIFFVLLHTLLLADVISGNRRKLKKLESLVLHAALAFIVSSLILSFFSAPDSYQPMAFSGALYWKNFLDATIDSPLFAFSKFNISAASVFPLYEGAALLLIYSVLRALNGPEPAERPVRRSAPAPRKDVPAPRKNAPAPQRSVRPVARTGVSGDDFAQLQNLADLRRQGLISDQEFYRRKRELLEK